MAGHLSQVTTAIGASGSGWHLRYRQSQWAYNSRMPVLLACIAGALSGRSVPVEQKEVTIGRDPSNKLVLPDPTVSRFHARAFARGNEVLIVDLDSTSGTYVDGIRITQPTRITPNSKLQLGSVILALQGSIAPELPPQQSQQAPGQPPLPYSQPQPGTLPPGCLFIAIGKRCALEVYSDKVRITRDHGFNSFMLHGLKGDREIFLRNVSGIVFKPVGTITVGYLQFSFSGGLETKAALLDAVQDPNTVIFEGPDQPAFEYAKGLIEQRIAAIHNPAPRQAYSPADELAKLHQLLQAGAITQTEYDASKRKLGF